MSISKEYQNKLREKAVKKFVLENSRSPSPEELDFLLVSYYREYASVDEIGISGVDVAKPTYQESSSASTENKNRDAILSDLQAIQDRITGVTRLLEDSYRGFQGTVNRTRKLLNQVEGKVDNLLLLQGDVDVFVTGIEESFDTQEFIDLDKTTASIEAGYCTLGRTGLNVVDLDDARISSTAVAEKSYTNFFQNGANDSLKEDDGSVWEYMVYTKYKQGRVSVIVDIELDEPAYVGEVRFTAMPINVNNMTTATLFYSTDGKTYIPLEPVERALVKQENLFNLGIEGVQSVRLMLSKNTADNETVSKTEHIYLFALDSIKVYSDTYTSDKESIAIMGPYPMIDEEGNPVYFTKAILEACVIEGDETSASFFLSKDGVSWKDVDHRGESPNIANFTKGSSLGSEEFINTELLSTSLLYEGETSGSRLVEADFATEALLNKSIAAEFVSSVQYKTISVKRNTVDTSVDHVYGAPSGWNFDQETGLRSTTVYVSNPEGRKLDLGPTSAYVNGNLVSGLVSLKQGYSVFATAENNWVEIPSNIYSLIELRKEDPLYPYNHRYIIQGYDYPDVFADERVYNGVEEYFGSLLKYMPLEQFNAVDSEDAYDYFTIDDSIDNLYLKVKVNKTDSSWKDERFDADWSVQADQTNTIYVKAVLSSTETANSPIIEDFKVRVI